MRHAIANLRRSPGHVDRLLELLPWVHQLFLLGHGSTISKAMFVEFAYLSTETNVNIVHVANVNGLLLSSTCTSVR